VLTGRGADIIIIDDPLKPEEALSEAHRQGANERFDHTLYSRLNDKQKGAIVLIMHRLHEDDLVGHVLAQEDWEIVRLPAIAEEDETIVVDNLLGQRCFERRRGAALHPAREPLPMLEQIRRTIGEYNFAGQYQQMPALWAAAWSRPAGSGITRPTRCRSSSASCRAGIPPIRRPSSAISASAPAGGSTARTSICSTCCAGAWNTRS
jgi:citrate lyase beta subunit